MEFSGDAIILSARSYGEHGSIIKLFFAEHGLFCGVARHARSKKHRGTFEPGNHIYAIWNARLSDHMGTISGEMITPLAALCLQDSLALSALRAACALMEASLAEREPHPALFPMLCQFLHALAMGEDWLGAYAQFEYSLLSEAGFRLDVSMCAATGNHEDLSYISPKTGRAVSKIAGLPYHDKLFALPAFFTHTKHFRDISHEEALDGLKVTGYFLDAWVFRARGSALPSAREYLMEQVKTTHASPEIETHYV